MKSILIIIWLTLFLQVTDAQEQAPITAEPADFGWDTVLPAGTLEQQPTVFAVDGGFAVAAESFVDPSWFFDSDWVLYDPQSGRWSNYAFASDESPLLDLDDNPIVRLDIAGLFPDDPGLSFQLVDGGKKAVSRLHAGEMLFDHNSYDGVIIINPAERTVERLDLWLCYGPPNTGLIVWDFPEQDLSVSCDLLIWHEGDSIRTQTMHDYIGISSQSTLHLISHSPDHRYWVLREYPYSADSGNYYVYDRHTRLTTVLLWSRSYKPQLRLVVWIDDSSLLINTAGYVLFLDLANDQRRELLRDEILALPGGYYRHTWLSTDGQWLVATGDGAMYVHSVFDTLDRQS